MNAMEFWMETPLRKEINQLLSATHEVLLYEL